GRAGRARDRWRGRRRACAPPRGRSPAPRPRRRAPVARRAARRGRGRRRASLPAARRRSGPSAPRARRTRARPRRTRAGSAAPRRPAGRARHRGGACTRQSPRPDLARRSGCCRVPRPRLYHTLRPKAGGCEGRSVFTFALNEEERLIQETARRFAHDRLRPDLRAHERARGVPGALAAEFAALGLDAVDVPTGAGGQGLGAFAKSLVLEELAAVDPGAALALDGAGLA